jgi:hypothetical protein
MTLRIFVEARSDHGVVALHGWLSAAEVGEVEKAVAELGPSARVDLSHLAGVDAEGLGVLRRLKENGTELTGASHYIALRLGWTVTTTEGEPAK